MEKQRIKKSSLSTDIAQTTASSSIQAEEEGVAISNPDVYLEICVNQDISQVNLLKSGSVLDIYDIHSTSKEFELKVDVTETTVEKSSAKSPFKKPLPPFSSLKSKNGGSLLSDKILNNNIKSEAVDLQKEFDVHCRQKCKILESLRYPKKIEVEQSSEPQFEFTETSKITLPQKSSSASNESISKSSHENPLLEEYDKDTLKSPEDVLTSNNLDISSETNSKDFPYQHERDKSIKNNFTVEKQSSYSKRDGDTNEGKIENSAALHTSSVKDVENSLICKETMPNCSSFCIDGKGTLQHVYSTKFIPRIAIESKLPNTKPGKSESEECSTSPQELKTIFGEQRGSTNISCEEQFSDASDGSEIEDTLVDSADENQEKEIITNPSTSSEYSISQSTLNFLLRKLSLEKYRKKHISPLLHALISPTESALRKLYKKGYFIKKSFKKKKTKTKSKSSRGKRSSATKGEGKKALTSPETQLTLTKSSLIIRKSPPPSPSEGPKVMRISPLIPRGTVLVASRVVTSPKSCEKGIRSSSLSSSPEKVSPKLRLFSDDSIVSRITIPPGSEPAATFTSWLTIHTAKKKNIKPFFPKRPPLTRSVSDDSLSSSSSRLAAQPPVKKARRSLNNSSENGIVYPPDNLYERFSVGLVEPEQEVEEILFYMYTPFTPELLFAVDVVAFHAFANRIENFYMPFGGIGAELITDSHMTVDLENSMLGLLNLYVYMYEDTFADILLHPQFNYNVFRKCLIEFWSKYSTSKYDILRFLVFCTMVSTFAVNAYEQGVNKAFRFSSLLICHAIEYYKYIRKINTLWDDLKEFVRNMKKYSKNPSNYLDK